MSPFPWTKPAPSSPRPTGPARPRPGSKPTPSKPRPKATALAVVVQGLALVAVGLVLIVAAIAAPAQQREPLRLEWRPATAAERQQHDRARLRQVMDELRTQSPKGGVL